MTGCAETPKGLSGSALKWIAVGTMLLDHIGAVLIERQVWPLLSETGSTVFLGFGMDVWYEIDLALRLVGRLAFPLFAFLLVEGFLHTRNVKTYALWMGAFALASEIPFDLAFRGRFLEFGFQNIFFTLLLGLLAVWGMQEFEEKAPWAGFLGVLAAGGRPMCSIRIMRCWECC